MALDLIQKIIKKIKNTNVKSVAIVMHNKPDGDCIGSAVALEESLKILGKKTVDLIIHEKINERFSPIIGENRVNRIINAPQGRKYDILFMVDFSNPYRTSVDVKRLAKYIVVLDHHVGSKKFGDIYLNESVSATGVIVYNIVKNMTPLTPKIANALYLSIRSDTSSFKNPNTDSFSHYVASKLLTLGANIDTINNIYESRSREFVNLMGLSLSEVQYDDKYNVAYLVVLRDTIRLSKVLEEEVSFLIDQIRGIKGIDIVYLFVEGIDNVRISARSKYTPVNEIMSYFGGGGHIKASGCAVDGEDIFDVVKKVMSKTKDFINSLN
jgi:phosphoesterase RecJ-like protein